MAAQRFPSTLKTREALKSIGEPVPSRSTADHSVSPPAVRVPRDYNAAYDLIERNLAAGRAAKLAYVDDAGQYTFGELAERVDRFGSGLQAMGFEMEHRVLLALTDTIDFPTAFLGAIKAGIIPIAVNTLLTPKDYEYMLSDSRAKVLIVSEQLLPQFAPMIGKLPFLKQVIVSGSSAQGHTALRERPSLRPRRRLPTTLAFGSTRRARPACRRARFTSIRA